jgi:hypothetical protein
MPNNCISATSPFVIEAVVSVTVGKFSNGLTGRDSILAMSNNEIFSCALSVAATIASFLACASADSTV